MAGGTKWIIGGVFIAGLVAGAATWAGWELRKRSDFEFRERLLGEPLRVEEKTVRFEDLDVLPAPVARYFRFALQDVQPMISRAHYSQTGELRTATDAQRWMSFEATHTVTPLAPGFMWDARVGVAPGIHVRVRDGYVAGVGSGKVSFLSAVRIAEETGGVEMNSGALHRYLAEAVWYPTALLPASGVQWTAIDGNRALATLSDRDVTVSLEFRFNDAGAITGIYTPERWGRFGARFLQVPWEGHFRDYEERDGMRIPMEGDVGWYVSGRWEPVWQGRMGDVSFEFMQ